MNLQQYRAHPALSQSNIKLILRSIAHYEYALANPPESTPQMKLGSAVHMAVLQYGLFKETYVVQPKVDKRTTVGKAEHAAFELRNKDKEWLSEDQMATVLNIRTSVFEHPTASSLINVSHCDIERALFGTINGVEVKGMPDLYTRNYVMDLKTTDDASPQAFARSCRKYRYDLQAAMYCYLTGLEQFVIVAVETNPPHNVAVYSFNKQDITFAYDDIRRAIDIYKAYKSKPEQSRWAGYPIGISTLDLKMF